MKEWYFVSSNGDEPEQVFFIKSDAFNTTAAYIGSFDPLGIKVKSYKFVDGAYTEDF